jgi:hypothetical protein
MVTETVSYEEIVALAKALPQEKLASWYEYGLFIKSRSETPMPEQLDDEAALRKEFAMWDAASTEDWLAFEQRLEQEELA